MFSQATTNNSSYAQLNDFDEFKFKSHLDNSIEAIKKILDETAHGKIESAENVSHQYADKYSLAEYLTNSTLAASLHVFSLLGFNDSNMREMIKWNDQEGKSVSLRVIIEEKCVFVKETKREEEGDKQYVTNIEKSGYFGAAKEKITSKVVTTITEYHFTVYVSFKLVAYKGVGRTADSFIILQERISEQNLIRQSKQLPYPEISVKDFDVNITWLLKQYDPTSLITRFSIDRTSKECNTPVQNNAIKLSFNFFNDLSNWTLDIYKYLNDKIYKIYTNLIDIETSGIFIPISPLFKDNTEDGSDNVILENSIVNSLLLEHKRSLDEKCKTVLKLFSTPPKDSVTSILNPPDVINILVFLHLKDLVRYYLESVFFIEVMLRKQLISAIGKQITPADFTEYMCYHNRKLFKEQYRPKPMCLSVRRSLAHSPEGSVSLLLTDNNNVLFRSNNTKTSGIDSPIYTLSKTADSNNTSLMEFALNSSTTVRFGGSRHIHAWLAHSFSDSPTTSLHLVAQARQFSSFIVLVGRIASATAFDPKYAIIVQNKDDITIPLSLRQIPTPKEFKDAIQSLSPEQQQLAKAFRSMQLESTLFGICFIQIKPHLETVLNLPPDSLTKEIKLTQDLMKLFVEYQIPSDLLSFDGDANDATAIKLAAVSKNVNAIKEIIKGSKEEEIDEQKRIRQYKGQQEGFGGSAVFSFGNAAPAYEEQSKILNEDLQLKSSSLRSNSFGAVPQPRFRSSGIMVGMAAPAATPPPPPQTNVEVFKEAAPPSLPTPTTTNINADNNNINNNIPQPSETTNQSQTISGSVGIDYTKFPSLLDSLYSKYDSDNALRPTIIEIDNNWTKKSQPSLLLPQKKSSLDKDQLLTEKNNAFDLLDALSKSGSLVMDYTDLHIVIAATHSFDKTLMDTAVQKNINPIERVERSTLIMASAIYEVPDNKLLLESTQLDRVTKFTPGLFSITDGAADEDDDI